MALDLDSIPIIDHHCHSLLREQPPDDEGFRDCFSESYYAEVVRDHVPHTLFYRWGMRELAAFYDCENRPEAIHERRRAIPIEDLVRRVVAEANIRSWLVDYGYSAGSIYDHAELKRLVPCDLRAIVRLEALIERLILESPDFDTLLDAYRAALADLRAAGYVGMKSIIAYRTGLRLEAVPLKAARAAYGPVRAEAERTGRVRIAAKPLLDHLVVVAVGEAHRQELPIQFHTGFGDPDLDLTRVDPAALRLVLDDNQYRGARFVLLHAGYPYVRTLGYLVSVYPNVYADLGLAIPFVAGDLPGIVRELLGLAPTSKVLYSSDAFSVPELYWLGARLGRRALGNVLEAYVAEGMIDEPTALGIAEQILWRNAESVYRL